MKNRKALILTVIILLTVVEGIYLFINNKNYQSGSQDYATNTQIDETKDWKTYINEKNGYELKYPSYLDLEDSTGIHSSDQVVFYINNPPQQREFMGKEDMQFRINIQKSDSIYYNQDFEDLEHILGMYEQNWARNLNFGGGETNGKIIKVGNMDAIYFQETNITGNAFGFSFFHNKKLYSIVFNDSQYNKDANLMVRSFKFTK